VKEEDMPGIETVIDDLPADKKLEVLQQRLEQLRMDKSNLFGLLKT
jgi:hypothetical protein